MATVIWTDKAKAARRKLYVEGVINFGIFTALKVVRKIESITDELEYFPELGYREPLLEGKNLNTVPATSINGLKLYTGLTRLKTKSLSKTFGTCTERPRT